MSCIPDAPYFCTHHWSARPMRPDALASPKGCGRVRAEAEFNAARGPDVHGKGAARTAFCRLMSVRAQSSGRGPAVELLSDTRLRNGF